MINRPHRLFAALPAAVEGSCRPGMRSTRLSHLPLHLTTAMAPLCRLWSQLQPLWYDVSLAVWPADAGLWAEHVPLRSQHHDGRVWTGGPARQRERELCRSGHLKSRGSPRSSSPACADCSFTPHAACSPSRRLGPHQPPHSVPHQPPLLARPAHLLSGRPARRRLGQRRAAHSAPSQHLAPLAPLPPPALLAPLAPQPLVPRRRRPLGPHLHQVCPPCCCMM
jgi:hypothetical protein